MKRIIFILIVPTTTTHGGWFDKNPHAEDQVTSLKSQLTTSQLQHQQEHLTSARWPVHLHDPYPSGQPILRAPQ